MSCGSEPRQAVVEQASRDTGIADSYDVDPQAYYGDTTATSQLSWYQHCFRIFVRHEPWLPRVCAQKNVCVTTYSQHASDIFVSLDTSKDPGTVTVALTFAEGVAPSDD